MKKPASALSAAAVATDSAGAPGAAVASRKRK